MDDETIRVDAETAARVRFAARVHGVTEGEVIALAVAALSAPEQETAAPGRDRWAPVAIYGDDAGVRVEGEYVAATKRLVVTSGACKGETFTTPSAAARAVVGALRPERAATPVNGWRWWRLAETHERLAVLR